MRIICIKILLKMNIELLLVRCVIFVPMLLK